jgi:branched-chain amino acid transport system permease protein
MTESSPTLAGTEATPTRRSVGQIAALPIIAIFLAALTVPFVANDYWVLIATRAAIYWILVSGLNLVVGFAGQLAIGYVSVLTLGAYTASVLVAGNATPPIPPYAALVIAAVVGAIAGLSSACRRCG